jgi:hypothetical protein
MSGSGTAYPDIHAGGRHTLPMPLICAVCGNVIDPEGKAEPLAA